jgi:hypothetical protein
VLPINYLKGITGQTGWMFAELLRRNHDEITAVYVETPVPPQRSGKLGTAARISAPAGVLLLSAPYGVASPSRRSMATPVKSK